MFSVPNGYIAGGTPDTIKQGTVLTFNCDPGSFIKHKNQSIVYLWNIILMPATHAAHDGTDVNLTLSSLQGGSLEITLTVTLKGFQIFLTHRKTFKYKDLVF